MKTTLPLLAIITALSPACSVERDSAQNRVDDPICISPCHISFSELIPNKAKYHGSRIYISGFLALSDGSLTLQPSEQAYLSSVGDVDAIVFHVPSSVQKKIIDSYLNRYVSVRGVFKSESDKRLVVMGNFSGNLDVYEAIVREVPESVETWKVRVEDLE